MPDVERVFETMRKHDVKYVDFRFTDTRGKWQHLARPATAVDESTFSEGIMFDGSSIAGWKAIHESDMTLVPDPASAVLDPFAAQTSLIVLCDVFEPVTGQPYARDPRSTAKRAEAYLAQTGIGDEALFGPELEFFVFDDVRFEIASHHAYYRLESREGSFAGGEYDGEGGAGHRPQARESYVPTPPADSMADMRAEMLTHLAEMGLFAEKHHHEVAPAQNALGFKRDSLLRAADNVQKCKYVVHQVAHAYGKTATFMPVPVLDGAGSGMPIHQSIWKNGSPVFPGNYYADLSQTALYYIGGLIHHAKAINAFANPTTNSYKRLLPGLHAPVLLAYSARNRSAACRIPFATKGAAKRVEVRFPDPSCNPYLTFAAMLLAGVDGIENRIHPGDPIDKNLYDLPPVEQERAPTLCETLREALHSLDADREFLKRGDVFSDDLIDAYIGLKREEQRAYESAPHPIEFSLYYSV